MRQAAACSGLFALGFVARCLPWPVVFGERGVFPYGLDAYYHLRRIVYTAAHFPSTLDFDPYINFPGGAHLHWTPLFDAALALLVRVFASPGDREAAVRLLVWIPPLLGALAVVGTVLLSRRYLGGRAALLAGLFLALLPAHVGYSQIGFIDHHAAAALASLGLLAAAMEVLLRASAPGASQRSRWLASGALGLAIAGAFLLQPGMLLEVAILEVGLLAGFLGPASAPVARALAPDLARAHLLAFALLAPFSGGEWERWGAFHPAVLSGFQAWLVLVVGGVYAAACFGGTGPHRARSRRLLTVGVSGSLLLAVSVWWIPELLRNLEDGLALFLRSGARAESTESEPLFSAAAGVKRGLTTLSGAVVLLPVGIGAASWRFRGSSRGAPVLLLCGWTAGLFVATLVQRRYANSLSIPLAMLVGWALDAWLRAAGRREARLRAALLLAGTAVVALCITPIGRYYASDLANQLHWLRGEPLATHPAELGKRILVRTAHWLRSHSEPMPGFRDATGVPPYGVLTSWTHGNVVLYEAERAVVTCNFGDDVGPENYALSGEYFRSAPDRAREILDALRVRYVVSHEPTTAFGPESMHARLHYLDGSAGARSFASDGKRLIAVATPVAALAHHRLVYESLPMPARGERRPAAFKIFEYVSGATIEGRAPAGTRVGASIDLTTNQGRPIHWRTATTADDAGRYTLVVPYPTAGGDGLSGVRSRGAYRVGLSTGRGPPHEVRVEEAAVADGGPVPGPDLRR